MAEPTIEPHRITKPIQMLAVWFAALVLIVGVFLTTARLITTPSWIGPMLAIAAVVFVPVFLIAAFLMQTLFRAHLQEDSYYAKWLEKRELTFVGFKAENVLQTPRDQSALSHAVESSDDFERRRIRRYEEQNGLFLIHEWRPSIQKGQVVDIVIWLHQHGLGPLKEGKVEKVEYQLGPKFFEHSITKSNTEEGFRLEVSAYAPMLCLAKAYIKGRKEPIELERYIDFEQSPLLHASTRRPYTRKRGAMHAGG